MRRTYGMIGLVALLASPAALAQVVQSVESPRTGVFGVKIGSYLPLIDRESSLGGNTPYRDTFGEDGSMWLVELEYERLLWQGFGSAGVSFAAGYAEKYGHALVAGTDEPSAELTSLKVVPLRVLGVYRFDWAQRNYRVPFVPYGKLGVVYTPWWISKGSQIDSFGEDEARGGRWGYAFTAGLAFQLDIIEPRMQRDFDSEFGVNHTYVFAEYTFEEVNGFYSEGLDLSNRRFSFGLAFEF